ncbi:protein of unknown function DUF2242 [Geotalea daltonii FRC-32]|uniref:DUF2442 domain-containing protein n=1 Tax=Geotalea daltonii (strain DSM 22248 / JCM 15807 / FRC-32) TaxID=316067 RepID=A0A068EZ83_GEODF|nr:protein of unknown function DUF2242 [Geotalea daltonii FRC-32]
MYEMELSLRCRQQSLKNVAVLNSESSRRGNSFQNQPFAGLQDIHTFKRIRNGGYFIEWENEVDLSADTLYLEGHPIKH